MSIPLQYKTAYEWSGAGNIGSLDITRCPSLPVGTPHDAGCYSPEHLLVAAAEICLANYVLVIAGRSKLEIGDYCSTAEGTLEQDSKRNYRFKRITIRPVVMVAENDRALAERVLDKAHRSCLIARSLNCPVAMEPRIISA